MIKTEKQLAKAFRDLMLSKHGEELHQEMGIGGEWILSTFAGEIKVTLFKNWVAICCLELERAKARIPHSLVFNDFHMNPYTGKWNIQSIDRRDYACIADFRMALFTELKKRIELVS